MHGSPYGGAVGRPTRIDYTGALQHVWARGARQKFLFSSPNDYSVYLARLAQTSRQFRWLVHGYCLMPNHVHLMIETRRATLSEGMKWFHETYARDFNRVHGYVGHAFQGRFGSKPIRDPFHEETVFWYVAMNPVEAGLCQRPDEYTWSSFAAVSGTVPPESFMTMKLARGIMARCPHPPRLRPPLPELVADRSAAAILEARAHGYLLKEIAEHLGVSTTAVHKRLRVKPGV
jgi:REP element-mobilizing transposase RayT